MAGITNLDKQGIADFNTGSYNSRRIENVELASGDAYLFFVDQSPDGGELVYDITKQVSGSDTKAFTSAVKGSVKKGMRVLAGCRRAGDSMTGAGIKWIGYKDPDTTSTPYGIIPIIEPYSVSVSYNKHLNQIDLYFWTNLAVKDGETPVYAVENVAVQQEDGVFYYDRSDGEKNVCKVLCYARGMFIKGSVNGTLLSPSDGSYASKESSDYIPVFETPEILHVYQNQDSLISDFSGPSKNYLPFDFRRIFKPESGTVDEKYAVCLPFGFWRRNETKVLRSAVTASLSPIYAGSDWFSFTIAEDDWETVSIPSERNDFHNLVVEKKCEIWVWLSDKGNGVSDPWYFNLSSEAYGESEDGLTSYVNFVIGSQKKTVSEATTFKAAVDAGLAVHIATVYRSEDKQTFVHQLYHGIKEDYAEEGAEEGHLPYDIKTVAVEGQASPDLMIFIPSTKSWVRDGIEVGSIDTGTTITGSGPWYKLNGITEAGVKYVWATLTESTSGGETPWYSDISNAKLTIAIPSNESELATALTYNAAIQIAAITTTSTDSVLSFGIQQLYHGHIKDSWNDGKLFVDNEDDIVRVTGDGNDPASDSIEKYTVTKTEGEETTTKEFIRISGMDETEDSGSHNKSWGDADSIPDDMSVLIRNGNKIGYLPANSVIEYLGPNGLISVVVAGGSEKTEETYIADRILYSNPDSSLSYLAPEWVISSSSSSDENANASLVKSFGIKDGKLVLETEAVSMKTTTSGGGGGGGGSYDVDILKSESDEPSWGIVAWDKSQKSIKIQVGRLTKTLDNGNTSSDTVYLPFDLSYRGGKIVMMKPVWRRYGVNVNLDGLEVGDGGWVDLSASSGEDIWAVLKESGGSETSNFIAKTSFSFDEWYGTPDTLNDFYLITYDGIEFAVDGDLHKESLHTEYLRALNVLRGLEYECDNLSAVLDEQIENIAGEVYLGADDTLSKLISFLYSVMNAFNDSIYDLDETDNEEYYPVYKFLPSEADPLVNAFAYSPVFLKADSIPLTAGGSITAKDFLKLLIDKLYYLDGLRASGEQAILTGIKTVTDALYPVAVDVQTAVVAKLNANFTDLKKEVYDQHLYLLSGSDAHYGVGEWKPDNLVEMNGSAFTYDFIDTFKAEIEDYCNNPTVEKEAAILAKTEALLQNDYSFDSDRSLNAYAAYAIPMQLPYYAAFYPLESMTSLSEARTVKCVLMGDPADFTVNTESEYVVALLNKLAYCHEWPGNFFSRREAFLSVVTDLAESKAKVLNLMTTIRDTSPSGTYAKICGAGGGTKTVTDSELGGTWVTDANSYNVVLASWNGGYLATPAPLGVAKGLEGTRKAKSVVNGVITPVNGPVKAPKVAIGSNMDLPPLKDRWKNNDRFGANIVPTDMNTYVLGGSRRGSPYVNLNEKEKKDMMVSIETSFWNAGTITEDQLLQNLKNGYKQVNPSEIESMFNSLKEREGFPKDALEALNDPNRSPSRNYFINIGYTTEGAAGKSDWSKKPTNQVYQNTECEFSFWVKNNINQSNPQDNDNFIFSGVYVDGRKLLKADGTPVDVGEPEVTYLPEGKNSTDADFEIKTYTFKWTTPLQDGSSAQKTPYGSKKSFLLVARFTGKYNAKPVYVTASPAVLQGTRVGFKYATEQNPQNAGVREELTSPVVYSDPGEVLVKKTEKSDVYTGYKFKEWQVGGVTVSPAPVDKGSGYLSFTVPVDSTITAFYEKAYTAITYSVNPSGYGYYAGPDTVEQDVEFSVSANPNEPTDPTIKYEFQRWKCLTPNVYPFSGASYTTNPNPSVKVSGVDAVTLEAVFIESHFYDPPTDTGKYRVIVKAEGGGNDCSAHVVGDVSEFDLGTSCIIATLTDYEGYYDFVKWSCPDADAQITDVNLRNTNFTSNVSKTYVVTATWTPRVEKFLIFNVNGVTNDMYQPIITFTVEDLDGNTTTQSVTLTSPDYTTRFNFDPEMMGSVAVALNVGNAAITKEDAKSWSYGVAFTPTESFVHNVWVSSDKTYTLSARCAYMVREGTGDYSADTTLGIAQVPISASLYANSESSVFNISALAEYTNPTLMARGPIGSGTVTSRGYWKYTFDKWESFKPVNVTYAGEDLHSGYFNGDTNAYETTNNSPTVTVLPTTFQTLSAANAQLEYLAYYTKTFVEQSDTPTDDLYSTITVTYDSTILTVNRTILTVNRTAAGVELIDLSDGNMVFKVKNGTNVILDAELISSGTTWMYSWGKDAYWSSNGIKASATRTYSFVATSDVTCVPHPSLANTAFVYIKYGPKDADARVSVMGSGDYAIPAEYMNSESIPTKDGYQIKFKIPFDKSFYLLEAVYNETYELDGVYNVSTEKKVDTPVTPYAEESYYEVRFKKIVNDIPVTYKIKVHNETTSFSTVYDGKSCIYGSVSGEDLIAKSTVLPVLNLNASVNSSTGNEVAFVQYIIVETHEDGTRTANTKTVQEIAFSVNGATKSIEVEADFKCANSTTPPEDTTEFSSVVSVAPNDSGTVSFSFDPSTGVTGTANYLGNSFNVKNGTKMTATASARTDGYVFKSWTVKIGTFTSIVTSPTWSGQITKDINLTAVFEPKSETPTGGGGGGGDTPESPEDPKYDFEIVPYPPSGVASYSPNNKVSVVKNHQVRLSVSPAKGYKFVSWGDGDTTGHDSQMTVNRVFTVTGNITLSANVALINEVQPPVPVTVQDDTDKYKDSVLPWYAPRNTTVMKILRNPSDDELEPALSNAAALHIGKVVIKSEFPTPVFTVAQYYHGERVDYIDYGDADCKWGDEKAAFKSIVFNDGEGADSNRKPARLYGFDSTDSVEIENPEGSAMDNYGLLIRKQTDGTLANGASLMYGKCEKKKVITDIQWNETAHSLQKKTEEVLIVKIQGSAPTDWEDIVEFVECTDNTGS